MNRTFKIFLTAAAGAAIGAFPPSVKAAGWRESSIAVGGVQRDYRVYVPAVVPKHPALLLSLHGGTGNMHTIERGPTRGWVDLADRQHFLLLVPNGTPCRGSNAGSDQRCWNDLRVPAESQSQADDVGFLAALIDQIVRAYSIDDRRVYLTGNSNGGLMTYRLLMEFPDRFAAAAVFIANLPLNSTTLRPPARPVPLLLWSGTDDRFMKYEGGWIPGRRGRMRSTPENVAWWVRANHADGAHPVNVTLPDADPADGCRVRRTFYPSLSGGAPVVFYLAEGGGHAMPAQSDHGSEGGPVYRRMVGRTCRDVDGASLAWDFMKDHERK